VRVLLFYLFTLPVLAQSIITIDMRKFTAQEIEGVYDFALSVRYDKKLFMNMTEAINGLSGMQNWNVLKKRQFLYLVYDDSIESYLTYILKLRNINFKNSYDGIQDVLNTLLAKIEESNQSIDQIINDELRGGFTTKSKSIGNIKGYFSLPTDELSKRVLKGYYAKIPYVLASTDDVTLLNIFYKFVDDYIELEKKLNENYQLRREQMIDFASQETLHRAYFNEQSPSETEIKKPSSPLKRRKDLYLHSNYMEEFLMKALKTAPTGFGEDLNSYQEKMKGRVLELIFYYLEVSPNKKTNHFLYLRLRNFLKSFEPSLKKTKNVVERVKLLIRNYESSLHDIDCDKNFLKDFKKQ
jgi:hypothetical protein